MFDSEVLFALGGGPASRVQNRDHHERADPGAAASKVVAAGLGDLIDACCISEAEGFWKPAPELFRIAAERCGESLEDAWMIGDNPITDIGGAAGLGIKTVWIRLGRTWPADLAYQPTRQADTVSEAVAVILSICEPGAFEG